MENISIERTHKTPEVLFDAEKHYLELKGISIPEDAEHFYRPLMEWIEEYILYVTAESQLVVRTGEDTKNEVEPTEAKPTIAPIAITIALKLIYFNTSTADYLVNILRKLREVHPDYPPIIDGGDFNPDEALKHWVAVNWCYEEEDEDMYDTGTHFESVLEMPFNYIPLDEIV